MEEDYLQRKELVMGREGMGYKQRWNFAFDF